jgi:hypothetical protein
MSVPTLVATQVLYDNPAAAGHVDTHVGTARSGPSKSHSLHRVTKIQTSDTSISRENHINFLCLSKLVCFSVAMYIYIYIYRSHRVGKCRYW